MKIERDTVVQLHYELLADDDSIAETTRSGEPVSVLIGARNVVFGLEQSLAGHEAGDKFETTVAPEQGYGMRREGLSARYSKKHFPRPKTLKPGDRTAVRTPDGMRWVIVTKIGSKVIDVDLNHPMAGQTLRYAVEVVAVRGAAPEELAHGHVHGPGGQH
ncbi:MAG: FKBP-type peptidyl-prolyl cis-trans isomerase SlyD [Gammaproteobacteria bacterium]|jgi:FKBP-type peptidyl-prolyl cis-trans isomerase SlyD